MNDSFLKLISKLLIVSILWLPFQYAVAGIVGTDQALAVAQAHSDRQAVHDFVSRADVAQQLQGLGIQPDVAQQRVDAMTDDEVLNIAGQLDSLPAGGHTNHWAIAGGVVVIALIIWAIYNYK